jgi:hypothetical protein
MLKALAKKQLREALAGKVYVGGAALLGLSFLPVVARATTHSDIRGLLLLPLAIAGALLAPGCAIAAFHGDFAKGAHRFLEFLPITRSAIWLVGYLAGVCALALSAVLLFSAGVLVYEPAIAELEHFVPGRFELVVGGAAALFWMFSIAVFPAASMKMRQEGATTANAGLMVFVSILLPISCCAFLGMLSVFPAAMELAPILLVSGLFYSAGSYALFALVPRHSRAATRAAWGTGLFLVCTTVLCGHLYLAHLTWREIDASEKLVVERVHRPHLDRWPDLLLAEVKSYRSGRHCVSLDAVQGAYHDLGRRLVFVGADNNDGGLLHFLGIYPGPRRVRYAVVSMTPDASRKESVDPDCGERDLDKESLKWLQNPRRLLYPASSPNRQPAYLCVADSTGTLLRRYEVRRDSVRFVVAPDNRVLTLAPASRGTGHPPRTEPEVVEDPYLLIDVDADTVLRFGLPGSPVAFAKDLRRAICVRHRIQDGRRYQSYVLVELPSLDERTVLPEDEFPPSEITSQAMSTLADIPRIDNEQPTSFLRVSDRFDTAFWVKCRVEGDYFRYAIVLIDLETGTRRVIVPEAETPKLPVVVRAVRADPAPVVLYRSTADGNGLLFGIGQHIHCYDLSKQESALIADQSILLDAAGEDADVRYQIAFSPSGRRILRYGAVYEKLIGEIPALRLKFAAIDVFHNGRPVRSFRGETLIGGAMWLDEERIVFHEAHAVYALNASGGPAQQILPQAAPAEHP